MGADAPKNKTSKLDRVMPLAISQHGLQSEAYVQLVYAGFDKRQLQLKLDACNTFCPL